MSRLSPSRFTITKKSPPVFKVKYSSISSVVSFSHFLGSLNGFGSVLSFLIFSRQVLTFSFPALVWFSSCVTQSALYQTVCRNMFLFPSVRLHSGCIQIQNVPKSPKVPIHKGFFCFCNVLKIAFYNKITTFPHNLLIVSP